MILKDDFPNLDFKNHDFVVVNNDVYVGLIKCKRLLECIKCKTLIAQYYNVDIDCYMVFLYMKNIYEYWGFTNNDKFKYYLNCDEALIRNIIK